jgi:hypothetical protein
MRRDLFDCIQGKEIAITYPRCTHVRLWRPGDDQRREIIIRSVRDLVTDPLSLAEFMRRPWLIRSRHLIKAYEPATSQWRQFYLGSTREYRSPGTLRVGLYEPGATRPAKVYGRPFDSTPDDRRVLIEAIKSWSQHDFGEARLRVFADDLRICG